MSAGLLEGEGVSELFKGEATVKHRPDFVLFKKGDEMSLVLTIAREATLQADLLGQDRNERQFSRHASKNADRRDMPPDTDGSHRLRQSGRSTHIDNMVNASAFRPLVG